MTEALEVNFDGLVGPTHNYAGLSLGNLASEAHRHHVSNPRAAALEGLAKMRHLAGIGLTQAVLPPQERPDLELLGRLGLASVSEAHARSPQLLAAACSSSSMWAANAATTCPSADSADHRVKFVPANLCSELHRSIEARATTVHLETIFADRHLFDVQHPLPATVELRDEGAANHSRFCMEYGQPGVHLFVWAESTGRHPGRQSRSACESLARRFGLEPGRRVYARQSDEAIDAGVFHNDVIAVGNLDLLLYHEDAWVDAQVVIDRLRHAFEPLRCIRISRQQLSLAEAVKTYLFNSQLVRLADGQVILICPDECRRSDRVQELIEQIDTIDAVHYVTMRQSMCNGGGPASMRLRVVLTAAERRAVHSGVWWSPALDEQLVDWVHRHYRDRLAPVDLADPALIAQGHATLDELTGILGLGSIYPFQRAG